MKISSVCAAFLETMNFKGGIISEGVFNFVTYSKNEPKLLSLNFLLIEAQWFGLFFWGWEEIENTFWDYQYSWVFYLSLNCKMEILFSMLRFCYKNKIALFWQEMLLKFRYSEKAKKFKYYRVSHSEMNDSKWLWGVEGLTIFLNYGD